MERKDLYTYLLIEEIRRDGQPTQRDLAKRLRISVGLLNSFIKRLIRKGYFKVSTLPRRRVKYLLTPKGLAERARLTAEYIDYSISYYRNTRNALKQNLTPLLGMGIRRVALWGVDELAELTYLTLRELDIEVVAVFYTSKDESRTFLGNVVGKLSGPIDPGWDKLVVAQREASEELLQELRQNGLSEDRIMWVLQPAPRSTDGH